MKFTTLRCAVQHYAWGDREFIPRLLGEKNSEGRPFAELWIGAHPDAPSQALLKDGEIPLNELIASEPEGILHPDVAARFSAQLPFLMKVLAAAAPLSLQTHPSKAAAEEGFAREERSGLPINAKQRNYRDRNHKPELIVALTDFYGLRGFRPLPDIELALGTTPEFRDLASQFRPSRTSLREIYSQLMTWPQDKVDQTLRPLVGRLGAEHQRKPFMKSDREYWLLRADREYSRDGHHDRGLFSIYLLNLIHLKPGEGMYLPAGILHAYLEGAGVEIMANSNNVLRGGLTPKHVDVAELLKNVTFEAEEAAVITGSPVEGSAERKFPTPADEFELSSIELNVHRSHSCAGDHSVEVFLFAAGSPGAGVTLRTDSGTEETFRPGAVFLIAAGTNYQLEADGDITLFKASVPLSGAQHPLHFRGRQVAELAFGTSGLRGLVTDITDMEAYINTRGFLDYLLQIGDVEIGNKVSIACDLRPSSDGDDRSILRAVARGLEDTGLVVDHLGQLPTPALTLCALHQRQPSIMVTGSHIPFDRNGIKFNKSTGEVLKDDEPAILRAVRRVRQAEYARAESDSVFDNYGMFKAEHRCVSPLVNVQSRDIYIKRYLEFFPNDALKNLRIVFYQHSAVGRDILSEILSALGAQVIPMGRSATFVPLDTEAISQDKLRLLQELADDARQVHGRIDAVVSTDGDSDRPLLAGITTDGEVVFFAGDILGILVAEFLNADAVVTPISASDAVDRWAASRNITVLKTRVGSPYVIEGMEYARRQGSLRIVGWEANGGFLTGSDIELDGRRLRALPTRDAALPLLAVLSMANRQRTSIVDLFARLPRRFSKAGLLDNFPVETSRALIQKFSTGAQSELEEFFRPEDGFSRIQNINVLDGLRIYFDNGDIAHIRPSGNAPQLRIYAVADTPERASQIVESNLREPDGILRRLESALVRQRTEASFVRQIKQNIALTGSLFSKGQTPEIIGTVCGSQAAQEFWQTSLDQARSSFGARSAVSFHEDLPTNQAFGLLLLWQRLKAHIQDNCGSLVAFVFGDGTRSTPFTETDSAQKPAMTTFVSAPGEDGPRFIPMVELAMKYFVPVQQFLLRSGFKGLVVKWGDEVQIPTLDLSGANDLFRDADIVRFVSLREIGSDEARNKDWVGVDADGHVTAFIPRRPLEQMEALAERGLVQRRNGKLFGGVNLGSIAVSYDFLDCLLDEFHNEVNDATADRKHRPALDPEFFTALTVAVIEDPVARAEAWQRATQETSEVRELGRLFPDLISRLLRAIHSLKQRHGRSLKMVAMDFGDQYWGDIGQHAKIYDFYMALNHAGTVGEIARALAGLPEARDGDGNLLVNSSVSGEIRVKNSVLINVSLSGQGTVDKSVLIGTRARNVSLTESFDVLSTVTELRSESRGGTYKVVSATPVHAAAGERVTTLFLPELGARLLRVHESTDLKDKSRTYSVPILGNPLSFHDAHVLMGGVPLKTLAEQRRRAEAVVWTGD